jgi:cyclopropane-fatty-acyl-phospholipid synthase
MNLIPRSTIRNASFSALSRITHGSLKLVTPEKEIYRFKGEQPGPNATLIFHDWEMPRRLLQRGTIAMGEDFIDQIWETDDIETLIGFFLANFERFESFAYGNFLHRFAFFIFNSVIRRNDRNGSRRNIEAHYDVGNDFYRLWLDESMTYSSGLYGGESRMT